MQFTGISLDFKSNLPEKEKTRTKSARSVEMKTFQFHLFSPGTRREIRAIFSKELPK